MDPEHWKIDTLAPGLPVRKSNAGRKSELSKPTAATYYMESRHKKVLEALARRFRVRGPSAALRHILDNYDFGDG